ncbi:MAG TPA: cytochrome D1 domain-containing protein, partial [Pyrinomonadaceae bacterium]|nr:cytochrome D1 domain-containing protein [Pyrinomonadaceae bacterium]
ALFLSFAAATRAQQPAAAAPPPQPAAQTNASATKTAAASAAASNAPQKITHEGVTIEYSVEPVAKSEGMLEGKEATVKFTIRDTTNQPLTNLRPAAWIDRRKAGTTTDAKVCREKVQSFLQAQLTQRPDIDLNSYYVLALNEEPNISVIDPLMGFGSSKLLTLVFLKSPGEDWVMTKDRRKLFVSMPLINQVAVVDTSTWKVVANVDAGTRPTRLRLQSDEKYVWVANDGDAANAPGGVTVIDVAAGKVAANIPTGAGHHEIAFSPDDRYAFVSNKADGTLSVIDVTRLAKLKEIKTGAQPAALAFSPLGRALYVANEGDGTIVAIDPERQEIVTRLQGQPGLVAIRFAPSGRQGFVVNKKDGVVYIFDASSNKLLHTVRVGNSPDQISFTKQFAYVRSLGSEVVQMINLSEIGKASVETSMARFPGGQKAPGLATSAPASNAIIPSPEEGSVLVANAADKMIYYYQEGMAAPMGSFSNYKREPRSVLVWDASLRETAPGVYSAQVQLTGQGNYDVAFLLDSPRVVNCFEMAIKDNPAVKKKPEVAIKIEPLLQGRTLKAGENMQLRFKVTDTATNQPRSDLKDIGVLTFLAPGIWQKRDWAKSVGEGVYEVNFVPPQEGVYYIFFQCPSLGVEYREIQHLILSASAATKAAQATP